MNYIGFVHKEDSKRKFYFPIDRIIEIQFSEGIVNKLSIVLKTQNPAEVLVFDVNTKHSDSDEIVERIFSENNVFTYYQMSSKFFVDNK